MYGCECFYIISLVIVFFFSHMLVQDWGWGWRPDLVRLNTVRMLKTSTLRLGTIRNNTTAVSTSSKN